MDEDEHDIYLKIDLSAAYLSAVTAMKQRISESTVSGNMLSHADYQAILDKTLSSMIELALISQAVRGDVDNREQLVKLFDTLSSIIVQDYDRIKRSIVSVEFHEKPLTLN